MLRSNTTNMASMMNKTNTANTTQTSMDKKLLWLVIGIVAVETILTTLALVPSQFWTRILPQSPNAALDGPFPATIAPVITVLIYLMPTIVGFLCRSWQRALLFATIPAWIGLGLFVIAATSKVGAFYLISNDHVTANVSVLELFAALGGMGWLARNLFKFR
jgi:hypothetical protein